MKTKFEWEIVKYWKDGSTEKYTMTDQEDLKIAYKQLCEGKLHYFSVSEWQVNT